MGEVGKGFLDMFCGYLIYTKNDMFCGWVLGTEVFGGKERMFPIHYHTRFKDWKKSRLEYIIKFSFDGLCPLNVYRKGFMNCDASVNNATVNIYGLWKPEVKPGVNEESASSV